MKALWLYVSLVLLYSNAYAHTLKSDTLYDDKIIIIDFGSQYTQLIARRLREIGIYCEIYPYSIKDDELKNHKPKGIILSGGSESVTQAQTPRASQQIFSLGCPILGICYGMQVMALQLGGEVASIHKREFGSAQIKIQYPSLLFKGIKEAEFEVWMSHEEQVVTLPPTFECIAASKNTPITVMENKAHKWYGIQFHPEVAHTSHGTHILENFATIICGCTKRWKPHNIIEHSISTIAQKVGRDNVILGLSGGVDSAVTAALLHRAIGSQLKCIFVDTGLLRQGEAEQVHKTFEQELGIPLVCIDAHNQFFTALKDITDPEEKRKIIGNEFIKVFEAEARKLPNVKWLAQGTIYSDVIESAQTATGNGHLIKSHHNVGGLPETLNISLLEPLRELFKDEVRKIGLELGLPKNLVYRHPFPGPGLAIRILGEVKQSYVDYLRKADAIFLEELCKHNLEHSTSQAFAVFLPVKSVAVKGDARAYEYVIALRAIETSDFMTARCAQIPHEILQQIANRIINEISSISRVVYDISSKPPATIEWE